jgi:hypothetical protein
MTWVVAPACPYCRLHWSTRPNQGPTARGPVQGAHRCITPPAHKTLQLHTCATLRPLPMRSCVPPSPRGDWHLCARSHHQVVPLHNSSDDGRSCNAQAPLAAAPAHAHAHACIRSSARRPRRPIRHASTQQPCAAAESSPVPSHSTQKHSAARQPMIAADARHSHTSTLPCTSQTAEMMSRTEPSQSTCCATPLPSPPHNLRLWPATEPGVPSGLCRRHGHPPAMRFFLLLWAPRTPTGQSCQIRSPPCAGRQLPASCRPCLPCRAARATQQADLPGSCRGTPHGQESSQRKANPPHV